MTDRQPPPGFDWTLIARYFAGALTPAEARAFDAQLASDPVLGEYVERLRVVWERSASLPESAIDAHAALARVMQTIDARAKVRPIVPIRPAVVAPRWGTRLLRPRRGLAMTGGPIGFVAGRTVWMAGIAAVLVLAAGEAVGTGGLGTRLSIRTSFQEFASPAGSRMTVLLSDGSRVTLGPASRLRVARGFGGPTRQTELDGEGVFTVVHDPMHPLTVQTARAVIRDVGTTFSVRAYADDPAEVIAVSEGEVVLASGLALRARDAASIDGRDHIVVRRGADVAAYFAWAQGRLVFDGTPLRDAIRDVARTFGLDITISDSTLAMRRLTGTFDDQSADQVLDAVTDVVGTRYQRVGRKVVIGRHGVAAADPASPPSPAPAVQATAVIE